MDFLESATVEELRTALGNIGTRNRRKYEELQAKGATLDPNGVILTKLELFIEFMLKDERDRLMFEYYFETMIEEQLDNAQSEVTRMQLLQGVKGLDHNTLKIPGT